MGSYRSNKCTLCYKFNFIYCNYSKKIEKTILISHMALFFLKQILTFINDLFPLFAGIVSLWEIKSLINQQICNCPNCYFILKYMYLIPRNISLTSELSSQYNSTQRQHSANACFVENILTINIRLQLAVLCKPDF